MMYKCIFSKHYGKLNGFTGEKLFKHTVHSQHFHIDICPKYEDLNKYQYRNNLKNTVNFKLALLNIIEETTLS